MFLQNKKSVVLILCALPLIICLAHVIVTLCNSYVVQSCTWKPPSTCTISAMFSISNISLFHFEKKNPLTCQQPAAPCGLTVSPLFS